MANKEFNPNKHLKVSIFLKDKELGDLENSWCFIYCYNNIPPEGKGLMLITNTRTFEQKRMVLESTKHLTKSYKEVKQIIETGRLMDNQGLITPGICVYEGQINWG